MLNPVYIDWAITGRCNLKCGHCSTNYQQELSFEDSCRLAEEITELNPQWVIIQGGEPLLKEGLCELLMKMKALDIYLITNGMLLNKSLIKFLKEVNVKIIFSMDGSTKSIYESTKIGANFEKLLQTIKLASYENIFYGTTVVLSKRNIHQIKELIELTEKHNGRFITFIPLQPFGEDELYYNNYAMSKEEHKQALINIYKDSKKKSIQVFYDEPFLWAFGKSMKIEIPSGRSGITIPECKGCAWGSSLYIQPGGEILPCMFSPKEFIVSQYPKESLAKSWAKILNSEFIKEFKWRKKRKGLCSRCEYFEICYGCASRIFKLYKDLSESDPVCPIWLTND